MRKHNNTASLLYELTLRRYLFGIDHAKGMFSELQPVEYIALHIIKKTVSEYATEDDKIYLQELSDKLDLTIYQTSKIARALQEKVLIIWSHDGDGSDGTYIRETDRGVVVMKQQDDILTKRYQCIIDEFGEEKLIRLLEDMKVLDEIIAKNITDETEEMNGNSKELCSGKRSDLPCK